MVAKKSKSLGTVIQKRAAVECGVEDIGVKRQCELLSISRRAFYYTPQGESKYNLKLMRRMDELYLNRSALGVGMMTDILRLEGHQVNPKRIHRLMKKMGIKSLAPGPHTSRPGIGKQHNIYPYLLRGRKLNGPNQVWSIDITYIPMNKGFMYLVAIIDWWSRYVLDWQLSNTMDVDFCLDALHAAIAHAGATPLIFNSDQGSQFTSCSFIDALRGIGVACSMDGRGRYLDNIFIERLWRSFKTEDIYLKEYENVAQLYEGTESWFDFYNYKRPHLSLDRQVPNTWYRKPHLYEGGPADWADLELIKNFWDHAKPKVRKTLR